MQLPENARDIVVDFVRFIGKHKVVLSTVKQMNGATFSFPELSEDELRYLLYDWFETRKEEHGNPS